MSAGIMRAEGPAATCVIVAFHRPGPLADLLGRLHHDAVEVVVVNVEADPEVSRVVSDVAGGAIEVGTVENVGYARAVNAGAKRASAGVVVFMNDDVRAGAEDVLDLARAVCPGQADVVVPRVASVDGRTERTISALPTATALAREWLLLPDEPVNLLRHRLAVQKWRAPKGPEPVEAAAAVAVGASTRLLQEVPLPEQYFLYWEESEWFWELRRRGFVVQYRPQTVFVHAGGRHDVRPDKSRLLARNAVRCVRRTQGRGRAGVAAGVVVLWNLRLVVVDTARLALRRDPTRRAVVRARLAGLAAALGSWREVVA